MTGRCLSVRQEEILRLLGLGMSRKEIARDLGISYSAASDYIRSIGDSLNVNSDTKLALYAVKYGHARITEIAIP